MRNERDSMGEMPVPDNALYGASTFDARNSKVLVSDRCDEMTVSLEFILRRQRYQITRSFSTSGRAFRARN